MASSNVTATSPPSPKFCAQCGSPVTPGGKFCPGCGATIGAPLPPAAAAVPPPPPTAAGGPAGAPDAAVPPPPPPPPPPPGSAPPGTDPSAAASSGPSAYGAAPVAPTNPAGNDIRARVDQDRGALKKLQNLIPGYHGYRQAEDIRAADSLLRLQVADRLVTALGQIDTVRQGMARDGITAGIVAVGGLRSEMQRLEGQIRHAEGGYSGISSTLKVTPQTLDRLYERDWTFVASADDVLRSVGGLQGAVNSGDAPTINTACDTLRTNLKGLETAFSQRMESVTGILQ